MQRITSIFLLSLFLFNVGGYFVLFSFQDSANRNEMEAQLDDGMALTTLRLSKSGIEKIIFKEGGKEISFNGEMYDVKSKSFDGEYIVFYCKHDKKETKLLADLDKQVKNSTDSNTPEKKQNNKNPVKDLFCLENNISIPSDPSIVFQTANGKLQTVNLPPLHLPPPEVSMA